MSETLAALLCKAMEENAVYDNHAVEPVCEALAASLVLDGVRVGDEGLRAARPCARYFGSDGTLCASHSGRFRSSSEVRCDRAALAATPTPPEIDGLRNALMDLVSIMPPERYGLLRRTTRDFIDAHRDPATPTPPEIDVERLAPLRRLVEDGSIYKSGHGWYSRVAGDVLANAIAEVLRAER